MDIRPVFVMLLGIAAASQCDAAIDTTDVDAATAERAAAAAAPADAARGCGRQHGGSCGKQPMLGAVVDASDADVGEFLSIVVPGDDRPVIAYQDATAGTLKVAKCRDRRCTGRAIVTTVHAPGNRVGSHTSIALGHDGLPIISHADETAGDLIVTACHDPACSAATSRVVDADGDVGTYSSIAIGTDGNPVISYLESAQSASALKVAHCHDRTCSGDVTVTRVQTGLVGGYTSLAIGHDGLPVISYHVFVYGQLRVAKCLSPDCTGSSVISVLAQGAAGEGLFSSLTVPPDGRPVISHVAMAHLGIEQGWGLKLAKCVDPACTAVASNTAVEISGIQPTSITVGADGLPIASYVSGPELSVATCNDDACASPAFHRIEVIGRGSVDRTDSYSAIAIGADGLPVIGFHADGALLVTRCTTATCE